MRNPYDFYTNNGLQRTFNNHGLSSLSRGYNIPDADLGIGIYETTKSIPVNVNYLPTQQLHIQSSAEDVTDTFTTIGTGGLNVDTFPMGAYYGEVLGEM